MNRNTLSILILGVSLFAGLLSPVMNSSVYAGMDSHESNDHDDGHHEEEKDEHDEHEEGKTEIEPDRLKQSGIIIGTAKTVTINNIVPLTGRITINQNSKAEIRARFPGIVRNVKVSLSDKVKKGQVLAIVESNESLRDYNLVSPIDGIILNRNTNIGDVVTEDSLFTIVDLSNVWAKFHIFPKDAESIKTGQAIEINSLDGKKEANSIISTFLPTADISSQTLLAITEIDNKNNIWHPGMTIEGNVIISQKDVLVAVKKSAIQTMEDNTVIFVKNNNEYQMKHVKTGSSDGEFVEIISGLEAGQSYVEDGSFIIKADILKSGAAHEH